MEPLKLKTGIECLKTEVKGMWALGIALSHWEEETYLCIHLFKWRIAIGKFYHQEVRNEDNY